jgi:hypothetical protein
MEIKVNNKEYEIKSGMEEKAKNLLIPYTKKLEIKEFQIDLVRIIVEGVIFEVSRKVFMEKIYPYLKELTKETLKD